MNLKLSRNRNWKAKSSAAIRAEFVPILPKFFLNILIYITEYYEGCDDDELNIDKQQGQIEAATTTTDGFEGASLRY